DVFVEGGAGLATELLAADRVDRLLIYRAPILVGGKPGIGDLGLADLADAHSRWVAAGVTDLAPDRAEVYLRAPAR
ncbi:MAG TPA: dihydrofolate reductase family protein, partial [Polymorphobacter sp.]|nr:dihydrofolate reductase family protein [Polymorphobacter sp.]